MSVITKIQSPTIEIYAKKYSDVPKEVILKEDLLRQGLDLSPAALKAAANSRPQAYFLFSYNMSDHGDMDEGEWKSSCISKILPINDVASHVKFSLVRL